MSITFMDFIQHLTQNPMLIIITLLMLGVMIVNGWSDAPIAVATCVTTRSLRPKMALAMAGMFNLIGVLVMTSINATVAETIYNMVDFGNKQNEIILALCATLLTIIIWSVIAWRMGKPISQSHVLIAGLSGAAISLHNGLYGINGLEWFKVLYGLTFGIVLGFVLAWIFVKITQQLCKHASRKKTQGFFRYGSVAGGAMMSFMHGAQNGQKFMGIFLLGIMLANGQNNTKILHIPIWLMFMSSLALAIGTWFGGYKIIKSVGMDMVKLEKYQGFLADFSASSCLLLFSLTGIPVSTTHIKLTAMMGVGAARRMSAIDWKYVKSLFLIWLITFPCAGFISFMIIKIFILIL